jgi:hypothetical protein
MIKKLSLIFGSKTKAQEIILLRNDAKEVVRQGFYDHELPSVERYCKGNNLHLIKSKFKVMLADENIFSNKGIRIPENDKRPGMYLTYISKDEQKAWLAAYYELMQNDKDLGLVLGYPQCCVDFFCINFNSENTNPQVESNNPYTNISKREQDCVLISHFPCNENCSETVEIAKNNLSLLAGVDETRAVEIVSILKN